MFIDNSEVFQKTIPQARYLRGIKAAMYLIGIIVLFIKSKFNFDYFTKSNAGRGQWDAMYLKTLCKNKNICHVLEYSVKCFENLNTREYHPKVLFRALNPTSCCCWLVHFYHNWTKAIKCFALKYHDSIFIYLLSSPPPSRTSLLAVVKRNFHLIILRLTTCRCLVMHLLLFRFSAEYFPYLQCFRYH